MVHNTLTMVSYIFRGVGALRRFHTIKRPAFRKPPSQIDIEKICLSGDIPDKFNFAKDVFDKHVVRFHNFKIHLETINS